MYMINSNSPSIEPCGTPTLSFYRQLVAVNIAALFSVEEIRPQKLQLSIRNTIVVQFVE